MEDKLNRFIKNTKGQFVEVSDRSNIYQCMDLAYLWVFCLDIPKATIQHRYAYEVFTRASDLTREYFEVIPYTSGAIPQAGDIIVWKFGVAGHIAIALGGNANYCNIFEQNNPLGADPDVTSKSYVNVLGWLRPKVTGPVIGEPAIDSKTHIPLGKIGDYDYGSPEMEVVRSMILAKDRKIKQLEPKDTPSDPIPPEPPSSDGNATPISRFIAWIAEKLGRWKN